MNLTDKVQRTIHKHGMLSSGNTVLVGVSGGPDSMTLLYALLDLIDKYGITLKIAHLNHGFRSEAAQEADFVSRIAASLHLESVIRTIDVPAIKEENGLSSQEAAREARYAFFEDAARETGSNRIALAHTSDDQAETVLIRLLRGSGPTGLGGIPPVRRQKTGDRGQRTDDKGRELSIIRPLIDCSRKEIEDYISEKDVPFITDSSNLKMDYTRNRVRMELIPFLEGYNPNIKDTLVRTAELLAEDGSYLDMETDKVFFSMQSAVKSQQSTQGETFLPYRDLNKLHPAISSRVIRKAITTVKGDLKRISFQHITDIMNLVKSGRGGWSLHLPGVTVSREGGMIVFRRATGRR